MCYNIYMDNEILIKELKLKLEIVQEDIKKLQQLVKDSLDSIDEKQNIAENIIELLKFEGVDISNLSFNSMVSKSIPNIVYEKMTQLMEKKPLHYSDIYKLLVKNGIPVPGKNPEANLLTQISRDERFVRVSPGTYGLADWGLTPVKKVVRKRKRKN